MKILVDTSVVVRMAHVTSASHHQSVAAVAQLRHEGLLGCIVPQVLYEYWVVVTRPVEQNGLGFTSEQATLEVAQLAILFELLRDNDGMFDEWQRLVTSYKVIGKNAHDTRLVAAMNQHGVTKLLTLNPKDFGRFTKIDVLRPSDFVANN